MGGKRERERERETERQRERERGREREREIERERSGEREGFLPFCDSAILPSPIVHRPSSLVTNEIMREILIPEVTREVNEGKAFANLRQIYHSMILAVWYKQKMKNSLLHQVYIDQNKTKGIDVKDPAVTDRIYDQYLDSFKQEIGRAHV